MGMIFYNLTPEELCDLICGQPEEDEYGNELFCEDNKQRGRDNQAE